MLPPVLNIRVLLVNRDANFTLGDAGRMQSAAREFNNALVQDVVKPKAVNTLAYHCLALFVHLAAKRGTRYQRLQSRRNRKWPRDRPV